MHLESTCARKQIFWLFVGALFLVSTSCQKRENHIAPMPAFSGLKVLILDRESGPGGERIRAEGMLTVEDADVAMNQFEAYCELLTERGFRTFGSQENGSPCRPPIAGGTLFGCHFEADRSWEAGVEKVWIEADGIDNVIGPKGDEGRGARIRISYDRTGRIPLSH